VWGFATCGSSCATRFWSLFHLKRGKKKSSGKSLTPWNFHFSVWHQTQLNPKRESNQKMPMPIPWNMQADTSSSARWFITIIIILQCRLWTADCLLVIAAWQVDSGSVAPLPFVFRSADLKPSQTHKINIWLVVIGTSKSNYQFPGYFLEFSLLKIWITQRPIFKSTGLFRIKSGWYFFLPRDAVQCKRI
jgi:hypothetical protein